MTTYYLMVMDWKDDDPKKQGVPVWDLIRKHECNFKKAKELAVAYSKELNNGIEFSIERFVEKKDVRYSVHAIPYSQAREHINFRQWKCNEGEI